MATVRPEGLDKLEKIHLIGTRSRDLPGYSIVSQPLRLHVPQPSSSSISAGIAVVSIWVRNMASDTNEEAKFG
jgi:hypothetical protein